MDNKNIIIVLIFVLVVGGVGIFFLLANPFSSETDEFSEDVIDVSNETYMRLSKSVKEVEAAKKWNKNSYALTKSSIDDALKNELINQKQATALQERLEGGYLILLSDTIVNFCEQGKDMTVLNELDKEVEKFSSKPEKIKVAKENIKNYRSAINSCGSVLGLVSKAYKKGSTDYLIGQIGINTTKSHIASNEYIRKLANTRLKMAREHKELGENVERIITESNDELLYKNRILSRVCSNSKYNRILPKYPYYKNICECISNDTQCDSTKIIQEHLPQN